MGPVSQPPTEYHMPSGVMSALYHDGTVIVVVSDNYHIRTFSPTGEKLFAFKVSNAGDVALSADGALAVTGSDDLTARLFTLADGKPGAVLKGHAAAVVAAAVTHASLIVSIGESSHDRFGRSQTPNERFAC